MIDLLEEVARIVEAEFAKQPCVFCETMTGKLCDTCELPVCDEHISDAQQRCYICNDFLRGTVR